jgi:halocyanin-like protein
MTGDSRRMVSRRAAVLTLGGIGGGLAGCVGGDGGEPAPGTDTPSDTERDVPEAVAEWLSDVENYDGTVADGTGQSEVTVRTGADGNGGNFAFEPPAVRIDTGTTVVWEWTGNGGSHNVAVDSGGDFESELVSDAGHTFEHTFEATGVTTYFCTPHKGVGMKGAVVVGSE